MSARRPARGLGSPVIIGALTTLITVVAVFLAYNANNGLPFVPTYRVSVVLPNAARLLEGNEVRIGGRRVGVVDSIAPTYEGDQVDARVFLKLDRKAEPLAQNSVFRVRYQSAFGLKYLEIARGDGPAAPEGFTFRDPDPARTEPGPRTAEVIPQAELDDLTAAFDDETRADFQVWLTNTADGVAGRGFEINDALATAPALLGRLDRVAASLARPTTGLGGFVDQVARVTGLLAPAARAHAELYGNAADVFAALGADPQALAQTIAEGPATLRTAIGTLPGQTRLLAKLTGVSRDLLPASAELRPSLAAFNAAMRTGTPTLGRLPRLSAEAARVFARTDRLATDARATTALERLTELVETARPLAEHVVPAQTVCNYWNYFFTFVPGTVAEEDQVGFTARQRMVLAPLGPTTVSFGGATTTVPGEAQTGIFQYSGLRSNGLAGPLPDPTADGLFDPYELPILHFNPYGPAGQHDADCQAGQAGYALGSLPAPGQPASDPSILKADLPGSRGPTTVFFDRNGERTLRDTRVPSRQP